MKFTFREEGVDWNHFTKLWNGRNKSPSARKVWIEIILQPLLSRVNIHLPRGRCGLKYWLLLFTKIRIMSPSARKVWIEIQCVSRCRWCSASPSARKVWIEMSLNFAPLNIKASPSARKVWIEIRKCKMLSLIMLLTFREEGVDWNRTAHKLRQTDIVTFREEGVDWNHKLRNIYRQSKVTFREEGVDWNKMLTRIAESISSHLPRGRCGLKCVWFYLSFCITPVTFREEGVDWNIKRPLLSEL